MIIKARITERRGEKLRGVLLGLMVVGLAGPLALGQVVDAVSTDGRTYGGFAPGDTIDIVFTFADLGRLSDWSIDLELGSALFIQTVPFDGRWTGDGTFNRITNPIFWSQFLGQAVNASPGGRVFTITLEKLGTATCCRR